MEVEFKMNKKDLREDKICVNTHYLAVWFRPYVPTSLNEMDNKFLLNKKNWILLCLFHISHS